MVENPIQLDPCTSLFFMYLTCHHSLIPGAHSMGRTHCSFIVDRLYNFNNTGKPDPSMKPLSLGEMRKLCPQRRKGQTDPLVFVNQASSFTNSYYSRVLASKSVIGVDQQLLYGEDTKQITQEFAAGLEDFRKLFALFMSRMGNMDVLTGKEGEIRKNCISTNKS
ncbi:putative peroxidase 26 [Hibiscus syriacus]|uniref:peroxidase n=1 Tax=Hibiscus syriacus TaxID=106335 RepID=A0A6A3ANL6_HIBSY|nr:putative peroxidase 26 [Hibiscus syriacus]